jgi:stage V sporulation protein G
MEVTQVRVFPVGEERLKAYATIVLDDCFLVRNLRLIQGKKGLFVAMPNRRTKEGSYRDVAHPITRDLRERIERAVIEAYEQLRGSEDF